MACPDVAKSFRVDINAWALVESNPDVGSSNNKMDGFPTNSVATA
eukprot:CAMPEP_0118717474 /NCGR_PEP_ID=MMETSP0800-20121206/28182_1 /TAXON_ID=210618 ORGANISM="Striatella unipunctata, Strain CCMP2910" /NCGR_SAMPLE_ID=MMETSP0800 /ASSEMBLY_ACC=CAM_ASM_000638 /LENGTH=44 /DNA_ID= /DNA_START= /DNA_END= /DNA_ORIENTATION=